ncbi:protocatechuate 3,4-dioxygenase subunit alpha [Pelagibius sp. 7325]|uniref:protocatechuate 3,4-dioxygenase subunit alpha n=1 Tax=Pelagibius sp. 7325 TaxID=3131994 RepID=UPI0030EB5A02
MKKGQTPSQTVGPYFAYGLTPEQYGYPSLTSIASADLRTPDVEGQRIRIEGRVFDGNGAAVNDAMIEIWQADPEGRYAHPADARGGNIAFKGFGRCGTGTDPEHRFIFDSVKPGAVDAAQAPHVNVIVFMRGLLSHLYTRLYFADEAEANAKDPVLQSVPAERRDTLIAQHEEAGGVAVYRFDIHMQGARETVFFDV